MAAPYGHSTDIVVILIFVISPAALQQKKVRLDAVSTESSLTVRIFDGSRQPISPDVEILMTITDGNEHQLVRD